MLKLWLNKERTVKLFFRSCLYGRNLFLRTPFPKEREVEATPERKGRVDALACVAGDPRGAEQAQRFLPFKPDRLDIYERLLLQNVSVAGPTRHPGVDHYIHYIRTSRESRNYCCM